jgi:stage II sporulation protein E
MKSETITYQKVGNVARNLGKPKGKKAFRDILTRENVVLFSIAFLLGRATLIGGLMPFGVAVYVSAFSLGFNKFLLAAFITLGMITGGAREQLYVTISAMVLFSVIMIPLKREKSKVGFKEAIIAFVSVMIPEMVTVYLQGFLLYDLLKAIFHGFIVFALVAIFSNASTFLLTGRSRKQAFSSEELISIAIIAALALSGLANIEILSFNIKNILCILLVLFFSFKSGAGAGAAIGVTVGLIVNMSTTSTPLIIGSYAFCGLLSGVFRKLGKVGAGLGFVMGNAVLTIYLNGSTEVLIYLKEILLAVIIFIIIPHKAMEDVLGRFGVFVEGSEDKRNYNLRIKEMTVEKLNKFSYTFREIAKTFSEISETKVATDKQDISLLFDRVADKICKDCSLCLHCWDRNFYSTYQVMFKVIEKLDSKGRIEAADIPDYFLERCERIEDFVNAVNNIYELFKVDMVWKSKIGESRGLVSQQLEGLSKVISNLATEIATDVRFNTNLEEMLLNNLNKAGIKTHEVIVIVNKLGKYEITIFHKGCGGKRSCISSIEKMVSGVAGRKMIRENNECGMDIKGVACTLRLVEEEAYRVITGVAKLSKHDGKVSGDTTTFMNTGDGKFIVALSDGMGTGQRAAMQSRATINLLEQFMETGFDKDTAVKMINSILVLKSTEEAFATIDLSVVDLFDGNVEFVKFGAVPTYIKRSDRIEIIKTASLPAGILSNIEVELVSKKLDDGDFIIMMSDGILDSFKNDEDGEKVLRDYVDEIISNNPQEIADNILARAYSNCDGKPIDDMTVVVAKVWKKL